MKNLLKTALFATSIFTALLSTTAFAKSKGIFDSDYLLENSQSVINVKSDGSSVSNTTSRWLPLNETGKQHIVQSKIFYEPNRTKIKFVSGKTLSPSKIPPRYKNPAFHVTYSGPILKDDRKETPVSPHQVITKEIGVAKNGIQSLRAMIVTFPNLELRSSAEYSYVEESKPLIPGVFSASFLYGAEFPEMDGKVVIRSEKPLLYKVSDPRKHLSVTSTQEGKTHVLTIEIVSSAYYAFKDEPEPVLESVIYPRVDVSTATSWADITSFLSKRYEAELAKPLPKEFLEIKNLAMTKSSDEEKFNSIIESLASKITYAGNWTADKGMYFPRGHKEVISTKTGDCKDFATSMVSILRSMDYKSDVALTYRGPGSDEMSRDFNQLTGVPSPSYFNHAIVHVWMKDGTERWLDPTNLVADSKTIFSDIAGSPSLILNSSVKALSQIPQNVAFDSTNDLTISHRPDGTSDITGSFQVGGEGAAQIRQALQEGGLKVGEQIFRLLILAGYKPQGQPEYKYDQNLRQSKDLTVKYSLRSKTSDLEDEDGKMALVTYPFRYMDLKYADPERVTNLYLGPPGRSTNVTTIKDRQLQDDALSDCFVPSPWLDIFRTTTQSGGDIVVRDEIFQKVNQIKTDDLRSRSFKLFLSEAGRCLSGQAIEIASNKALAPDPKDKTAKPKIPNNTLVSDLDLQKAKYAVDNFGDSHSTSLITVKAYLDRYLEKNPNDAKARILKARATYRMGFDSGDSYEPGFLSYALDEVNRALQIDPNNVEGLLTRTNIEYYKKDIVSATRDFNQIRKIAPSDTTSVRIGSKLAILRGQSADAERWLLFGLAMATTKEDKASGFNHLAEFYLDTNQPDKAIDNYKKYLEFDPKSAWTWNNISIVYKLARRYDEAIDAARNALKISVFGAAKSNLASALCEKSKSILNSKEHFLSDKSVVSSIEQPLFEGVKEDPESDVCLFTAANYYEVRAYTFSEADSARRAKEYYDRAKEIGSNYQIQIASSLMDSIQREMVLGKKANEIRSQWPRQMFAQMEAMERRQVQNVTPISRIPASPKPPAPASK